MTRFKVIIAVHLFLIKDDREILLARRFNTGYEDGNYSVVAGHVEEDETILQAVKREALEEVGIHVDDENLDFLHVMYRRRETENQDDRVDFFFATKNWQGIPKIMEIDKCDNISWFPIKELPLNIIPYVKTGISEFLLKKNFSEYGW